MLWKVMVSTTRFFAWENLWQKSACFCPKMCNLWSCPKKLLSRWPMVETNKFDDHYAFAFDMSIVSICLLFVGLHLLGRLTYSLQERWPRCWHWPLSHCCCCTWWRPPPRHSPPAQDFLDTALRLFLDRWKPQHQFDQNQLPPTKAKCYKIDA